MKRLLKKFSLSTTIWFSLLPFIVIANSLTATEVRNDKGIYPKFIERVADSGGVERFIATPATLIGSLEKQIILFSSEQWQVRRSIPNGYLDVYSTAEVGVGNSDLVRVDTPLHWRKNSYPLLMLANPEYLYFVIYDVVTNVPSGRSSAVVKNGFDLYRLSKDSGALDLIAEDMPLGGIDTMVYGELTQSSINLCGNSRCISVSDEEVREWSLPFMTGREFVEVSLSDGRAAAIIRNTYDDRADGAIDETKARYELAVFDINGGELQKPAEIDGVPWNIRWDASTPTYLLAKRPADFGDIFYFDFNRMPFQGTIDFGGNNLEGRIAWSQFYYLNALLSLMEGRTPFLAPLKPTAISDRLCAEVELIGALAFTKYPGYLSKRYSIDREPLLSALHLGRVAELLDRAGKQNCTDTAKALRNLKGKLSKLNETLEIPSDFSYDGKLWRYLTIRKGAPFWSDGSNVPYNYISGYIRGYLAVDQTPETIKLGEKLLLPLLTQELNSEMHNTWRYWWGRGDDGWTDQDGVSLNTPSYKGNMKALAHVSYRTMDASAVISLFRKGSPLIDIGLVRRFQTLVEQGWLLPSLNEALFEFAGPIHLSKHVALRFARISSWSEMQSQVWALNQLASEAVLR